MNNTKRIIQKDAKISTNNVATSAKLHCIRCLPTHFILKFLASKNFLYFRKYNLNTSYFYQYNQCIKGPT